MSAQVKLEALENRQFLSATPLGIVYHGERYFARYVQNQGGEELWKSDLDGSNPTLVKDIYSGGSGSHPHDFVIVNDRLLFIASNSHPIDRVFVTDGTANGTFNLTPSDIHNSPFQVFVEGDRLYFNALSDANGVHWWVTDGTLAGTLKLPDSGSVLQGTLYVYGHRSTNDVIDIDAAGGSLIVTWNGESHSFDSSGVQAIRVETFDGNDLVTLHDAVKIPATLDGENGNDTLTGGGGNDILIGGGGTNVLDGGAGNDTADYSSRTYAIQTDFQSNSDPVILGVNGESDTVENFETLLAGSGNDSIKVVNSRVTTNQILFIDGGPGDDTISLQGQVNGVPTVRGGDGNDMLIVRNNIPNLDVNSPAGDYNHPRTNAYAYGDAGNDTIGSLADDAWNSDGTFYGGDGIDTVDYSKAAHHPWAYSSSGHRWLQLFETTLGVTVTLDDQANDGPFGDDNVHSDIEVVIGSTANDVLKAGNQPVTLIGNGGNDTIVNYDPSPSQDPPASPPPPAPVGGTASTESSFVFVTNHVLNVKGTTGNDRITIRHKPGDASVLQVVRNGKISNFTFSDVNKIEVNASNGHDWIDLRDVSIDATLLGGNGNDSIFGSQGADSIDGGRGDDLLAGNAGNDSITGGIGTDVIRGGEGVDRLYATFGLDDTSKNKGDALINIVL